MRIVETNYYTSFADYFRKSVGLRFTILCKCCFFPYIAIFVQFDFSHLANLMSTQSYIDSLSFILYL